jgi:hypothetical protein
MAAYTASSRPGSVVWANALAWLTRFTQVLSEPVVHVVITSENPASLPPMEIVTRVVPALSALTWLFSTSAVTAPEHAANVSDAPCALVQSGA